MANRNFHVHLQDGQENYTPVHPIPQFGYQDKVKCWLFMLLCEEHIELAVAKSVMEFLTQFDQHKLKKLVMTFEDVTVTFEWKEA